MSAFVILILILAVAVILVLALLTSGIALFSIRSSHVIPQVRNPDIKPGDIQHALQVLLDTPPGGKNVGFVIFHGHRDLDFVQFLLDPDGLLLN